MDVSRRVMLTDGSNSYFFPHKCRVIEEGTWFNGHNHVSLATNSEWYHERLFVTPRGRYILHSYSDYAGVRDTYEELEPAKAAMWLMRNGYELPEDLQVHVAGLEIE